jgi:hypothetical protein
MNGAAKTKSLSETTYRNDIKVRDSAMALVKGSWPRSRYMRDHRYWSVATLGLERCYLAVAP